MGEKKIEFKTSLSTKDCGFGFETAIKKGRGTSAWIGGVTAKVMGGEALTWYTPRDESVFASLNDDTPTFTVGVGVPKAMGAHQNGANVEMYVWDRGDHREVVVWAHHSLTGGAQATKLIENVRAQLRA